MASGGIGSAVGAVGSLVGGAMSSGAAEDASQLQAEATEKAIAEQQRQFDLTRGDLEPWRDAGAASLDRLQHLLGIGGTGSVNPAVTKAQRKYDRAQTRVDELKAQRGASAQPSNVIRAPGPTQFGIAGDRAGRGEGTERMMQQGYLWSPDNGGYWYKPGAPTGGAPSGATGGAQGGSALERARARLKDAKRALKGAQAQPWDAGPEYGSLMTSFEEEQPFDFETEPGYQWRLGQGNRALQAAGSALGGRLSGRAAKELTRFNQGFASNEYGNSWGRYKDRYNMDASDKARQFGFLSGTAGMGQGSAHTVAGLGQSAANNISDLYTQQGNALAAGQVGQANAWGNALGNTAGYIQTGQLLNQLKPKPSNDWT